MLHAAQKIKQFTAVCGDKVAFQRAGLELHRDIVVITADQAVAALKVGDLHDLRFGEVQYLLNALGFFILQIQYDLGTAVVDDTLAVLPLSREKKSFRSCVAQMPLPE